MNKPLPQAPSEPARRHNDGTPDKRYSLAYEWLGYSEPMLALRFCGDLIGVPHGIIQARRIANAHYDDLFADLIN